MEKFFWLMILMIHIYGWGLFKTMVMAGFYAGTGNLKEGLTTVVTSVTNKSVLYYFLMYVLAFLTLMFYFPSHSKTGLDAQIFQFTFAYVAISFAGSLEDYLKTLLLSTVGISFNLVLLLIMGNNPESYPNLSGLIVLFIFCLVGRFTIFREAAKGYASFPSFKEVGKTFSAAIRSSINQNDKKEHRSVEPAKIGGLNMSQKRSACAEKATTYKELYGWKKTIIGGFLRLPISIYVSLRFITKHGTFRIPRLDSKEEFKNFMNEAPTRSLDAKEETMKNLTKKYVYVTGQKPGMLGFIKVFNSHEQAFAYCTTISFGLLLIIALGGWYWMSQIGAA